jgi:hypothetical protein
MILNASALNGSSSDALRTGLAVVLALDGLEAVHGRHVQRARQEVDDGVQQRLHARFLNEEPQRTGGHLRRAGRLADRGDEAILRDLLLLEDHLEQLVVVVARPPSSSVSRAWAASSASVAGCPGRRRPCPDRPCRRSPSC